MLDFDNTEVAFRRQSDRSLRRSYILFKVVGSPLLVKVGKLFTGLALFTGIPVGWAVKPLLYRHFAGGECLSDCRAVINELGKYGVYSILDYSVEGSEKPEEMDKTLQETMASVAYAASNPLVPFAVFKPTAFGTAGMLEKASLGKPLTSGEEKQKDDFSHRMHTLGKAAYDHGVPLLVDAENYAYQAHIDRVVEEMMERFNRKKAIVWNTLQMYRKDRLSFLKKSINKALEKDYYFGVKLVRGAYMEQERARAKNMGYQDPIHPNKETTDKHYNEALAYAMEHAQRVSVFNGTHNEESSKYMARIMREKKLDNNDPRFFFSQLYGMSDHISFNLAREGYNVAKYVPYGPVRKVLPYLIRRAEENTSVKGQTGRELALIIKEKNRRRSSGKS